MLDGIRNLLLFLFKDYRWLKGPPFNHQVNQGWTQNGLRDIWGSRTARSQGCHVGISRHDYTGRALTRSVILFIDRFQI